MCVHAEKTIGTRAEAPAWDHIKIYEDDTCDSNAEGHENLGVDAWRLYFVSDHEEMHSSHQVDE